MTDPRVTEAAEKIDAGIGRQHRYTSVVDPRHPGIVNVIEHPECEVCVARSALDSLLAVIREKDEALRRAIELEFHLLERAQAAEAKLEQAREAIAWVLEDQDESRDHIVVTLREEPNRDSWFRVILPVLDYEIRGGTWDEPLWAWTRHPWFRALGLTVEECEDALSASEASEEKA